MDDDEIETEVEYPDAKRHDRWSVIVLSLSFAANVVVETADYLNKLTIAASQHGNQLEYDKKFNEIVRDHDG